MLLPFDPFTSYIHESMLTWARNVGCVAFYFCLVSATVPYAGVVFRTSCLSPVRVLMFPFLHREIEFAMLAFANAFARGPGFDWATEHVKFQPENEAYVLGVERVPRRPCIIIFSGPALSQV